MLVRILTWLESSNLLAICQSGFRKGRQTKDHILRLVQAGTSAFNKEQYLGALFVDIEKAFDKVWHKGLLCKLDSYNIPSYLGRWIENYLSDRSFQVRSGEVLSTIRRIETGVPQGSVLGPVLFLIFFNDIVCQSSTPRDPEMALYADDLGAWVASRSLKVIQIRLQKLLDHIKQWMSLWRSKISTSKTVYTIFNKGKLFKKLKIELKYDTNLIQAEKNFKFLGTTLDLGLTFNKHAEVTAQRAARRLNMLRKIKGSNWGASQKLIITSYKVLIRPIIEYPSFAILMMAKNNQKKLIKIQNEAIRIATFWPLKTSSIIMNQRVGLDSLESRALQLTDSSVNHLKKTV